MKRACDSSSDSPSDDDEKIVKKFQSKISTMMYTFGDAKEPHDKSVELMYIILREQMNYLLIDAEKASKLRGSKEISHREILFVMRRNKAKLRQLLQYLEVLDSKPSLLMTNMWMNEGGQPLKTNKVDVCKEFLASIEDCQEFTSLMQDKTLMLPEYIKKRLERRLLMIECMTANEYEEFSRALQESFCQNRSFTVTEFKSWLKQDKVTSCSLTQLAVIIISFLARETIAEIVDRALLIKSNKLKGIQMYEASDLSELPDALANEKTRLKKKKGNEVSDLEHLENISLKEARVFCNIHDIVNENGQNYSESSDAEMSPQRKFNNLSSSVGIPHYINEQFIMKNPNSSARALPIKSNKPEGMEMYYYPSHSFHSSEASARLMKPVENSDNSLENLTNEHVHCNVMSENNLSEHGQNHPESTKNLNKDTVSDVGVKSDVPSPNLFSVSTDEKIMSVPDCRDDDSKSTSVSCSNSSEYVVLSEDSSNVVDTENSSKEAASDSEVNISEESLSHNQFSDVSESPSILTQTNDKKFEIKCKENAYQPEIEVPEKEGIIKKVYQPITEEVSDTEKDKQDDKEASLKGGFPDKLDTTSIDNYLDTSNKNEAFLCRTAITPEEIREAFVQFNEPSPLAYFFSNHPVRLKKKFCLAGSLDDS